MTDEFDARHLKLEADRIDEQDATLSLPGRIPRTERIESQPRAAYRPPSFLRKTAGDKSYADLCEYLEELWRANEEHVGRYVTEVEVFLALSGEYHFLRDCFMSWCREYFLRRVRQDNPKDKGDPFETFIRLAEEGDKILGHLEGREHTVNCTFLNEACRYAVHLLFERTWKTCTQRLAQGTVGFSIVPASRATFSHCVNYLNCFGLLDDHLTPFLTRAAKVVQPDHLRRFSTLSDNELRRLCKTMVDDIGVMRPFLVRNFNPQKTVTLIGPGLAVAWSWCVESGIANILVDDDEERIRGPKLESKLLVKVNLDGLLIDGRLPWIDVSTLGETDGVRGLAVNAFVLDLFHDRLLGFYDRIDFARIRRQCMAASNDAADEETQDEVLAVACLDLAAQDVTDGELHTAEDLDRAADSARQAAEPACVRFTIRPLRLHQLLNALRDKFHCEITPGKGSEVAVFRPGGKKFSLGRHRADYVVPLVTVKQLLRQLGIGIGEWVTAIAK